MSMTGRMTGISSGIAPSHHRDKREDGTIKHECNGLGDINMDSGTSDTIHISADNGEGSATKVVTTNIITRDKQGQASLCSILARL